MREVMQIIKTMPREEWILCIMMVTVFPAMFWAVWVMTP
jgi:hypothetical protein